MRKLFVFLLSMIFVPIVNVYANDYEAKIIIKGVSSNLFEEYNYENLEDAFKDAKDKETFHNKNGNGGVVTVTIQLLKDCNVDETLIVDANKSNFMLDFNGNSLVSSADPVIQAGPMTFISNSKESECSVTQKDVNDISKVSPNTIFYAPIGTTMFNINAKNLIIGDDTNTIVNSQAMLPSILDGVFKGKMIIKKPIFGSTVRGGFFSQDPTEFIDTNASEAVKNDKGLYYIVTYHAALIDDEENIIKKYGLLRDAISNAKLNGTVKLLKQGYPDKTVVIEKDDIIALDLSGFQLTGAASKTATIRVDGNSLIKNLGTLTIKDSVKSTSMNFVYDDYYKDDFFTTLHNKGIMNLENIGVYVNYNQPNYKGNIYTVVNDSSDSAAIINISSETSIGGSNLELEDPATGKYPAIMTTGVNSYKNEINIKYNEDMFTYSAENIIVYEIMDVFDNNGNYSTIILNNNHEKLHNKNIKITKDGEIIDFIYDESTGKLTIPSKYFTDNNEHFEFKLQYEVNYVVDGKIVKTIMVESGKDALILDIPKKEGYIASWDKDGKNIIENTTITLKYIPNNPNTSDNIILWLIISIISNIGVYMALMYIRKYRFI